jgi:hypothetical protein
MTKHSAKKISAGHYLYRGWTIKRFDYGTLGDPECRSVEWNIYAPGEETWNDSEPTLSIAKWVVDTRIKQAEERCAQWKKKPIVEKVRRKVRRQVCPIFGIVD